MELLDISFDEITPTTVRGSVAADERHHQPWGLIHGGLYTTVIETFATTGAYEAVKDRGQQAVGVSNTTDFLRPHQSGRLNVEAVAINRGGPSSSGKSRFAGRTTQSSSRVGRSGCRTSRPAEMSDSRTSVQEPILGAWTLSSYVIADVSGENREYPVPCGCQKRCSRHATC